MQKFLSLFHRNDYLKLFILFTLSQGWMLLNEGIYWDDWVWFNNPSELSRGMEELGIGFGGIFLEFIYNNPFGVLFSKFMIFSLYLLTGMILRHTFDLFRSLSNEEKFYLTVFFMLAPLNLTKHTLCVANNALSLFLFYTGSYIAIKYQMQSKKVLQLVSVTFLFLSYFTNSLLPFSTVLYLAILYKLYEMKGQLNKELLLLFLRKNYIYLVLPIIFWITKKLFFIPSGVYASYNVLKFPSLKLLINGGFKAFGSNFLAPFSYLASPVPKEVVEIIIGLFILYFVLKYLKNIKEKSVSSHAKLVFGLIAFVVAVAPYLLVGKVGTFTAYESRHQLLQPLGYAFLVYYFLDCLKISQRSKKRVLQLFIFLFLVINIKVAMDFQANHFKQIAIMNEFSKNPVYKQNNIFLIDDDLQGSSVFFPKASFYAYTGIFYEVFDEQTRIAASNRGRLLEAYDVIPHSHRGRYKMQDLQNGDPQILVEVATSEDIGIWENISLLLLSKTDESRFIKKLESLFTFKYSSLK